MPAPDDLSLNDHPTPSSHHAARLMRRLGLDPDPWQLDVLTSTHPRLLLNCCRQAGKSTTVAALALAEALAIESAKVILLSRSYRQSAELFRTLTDFHRTLDAPLRERLNASELVLANRSRVLCLPCREDTIRGFAHVTLLVIDEAARVPDTLYRAVRPMLAVSGGRMVLLSTPFGRRGFFYDAWARGGDDWQRVEVPAAQIPRIPRSFLDQERRALGDSWFRQEYCCSFEALEGLVYPDFARCVVPGPAPTSGRLLGGIDFGFRNPFAAVWGLLDRDDVLWLTGEHYRRQMTLDEHALHLPNDPNRVWLCDPAGAQERCELIRVNFRVNPGVNALTLGIMAVTARLNAGTLKVIEGACPNLLHEATLYRYADPENDPDPETPVDEYNHALAALRYLVATIDRQRMARPNPTTHPAP